MASADYTGIDTVDASAFGMARRKDIVYYPGGRMPFDDATFDHVLCTEVLEHVPVPVEFLAELGRVLRPGGTLLLTVPWSARVHHVPHDFHRFTRYGLEGVLRAARFKVLEIEERGNDLAAIANKLLVWCVRLLRPRPSVKLVYTGVGAILLAPLLLTFMVIAHMALYFGWGSKEDPLGYGASAVKPS